MASYIAWPLYPWKELPIPIEKEAGWTPEPVWSKSSAPKMGPHFLNYPAHSLVTVLTMLAYVKTVPNFKYLLELIYLFWSDLYVAHMFIKFCLVEV